VAKYSFWEEKGPRRGFQIPQGEKLRSPKLHSEGVLFLRDLGEKVESGGKVEERISRGSAEREEITLSEG